MRRLLVFAVIFLAFLLSLLSFGLHYLEQHKHLLEDRISLATGSPVTVGSVQAHMYRLQPQIRLQQVTIFDPEQQQALLKLADLRLGFSLWRSLFSGRIRLAWLQLSRAEVSVTRNLEGQIAIAGLQKKSKDSADWLLDVPVLSLTGSEINWVDQQQKLLNQKFSQLNVTLLNSRYAHQLSASLTVSGSQSSSLRLLAHGRGQSLMDLRSHFYLQGKQIDLLQLLGKQRFYGYQVASGLAGFQLWGDANGSGISAASGNIHLTGLSADYQSDLATSGQTMALTGLDTRFQWSHKADSWQLDTDQLLLEINNQVWPSSSISVKIKHTDDHLIHRLQAAASLVDLEVVSHLLLVSPWAHKAPVKVLKSLALNGKVQNLSLTYDALTTSEHRFSVCADIQQLTFKPWKSMPGVSNLAGHICGDPAQGSIDLAIREGILDWPGAFPQSIRLTALQGRVNWQANAGQWQWGSNSLQLDTPDFVSHHRFQLLLPKAIDNEHQPFLDWDGTFTQGRISAVKHYLPIKLKPKLLSWLKQAFVSGQVTQGQARFNGPLPKFPFKQNEGLFEITFRVQEGELNFGSKWSNITGIAAQVGFHNNRLEVNGSGYASGARIQSAQVNIPALGKNAELSLEGTVMGTFEQGVSFVRASPLVNIFDPVLDIITPTGNAKLDLQLKIPMAQPEATEIYGTTYLRDSRVTISALDLTLDKLNGAFRFDRNGLESETIHAMALSEPVQINFQHDDTTQRIHLLGVSHSQELVRYYQPLTEWITGTLPYQLEVRIPWRQVGVAAEIELNSSLQGLAIHLPAPLGKSANDSRHFQATLAFPEAETMPLNINYGRVFTAALDLHHSESGLQLYGGMLGLGERTVVKRDGQQGLSLSANFNRLDLKQWLSGSSRFASGQQVSGSTDILKSIEFKAQHLSWGDQAWGSVSLMAQRKATIWSGVLNARDIKGTLNYKTITARRSRAKLSLDLEYLKLHPAGDKTADQKPIQPALDADAIDPLAWPDLDIKTDQLFWKSNDLGSMELKTYPQGQELMIDHFNIFDDNHHQLAVSGSWFVQGKAVRTQLQGKLDFMDMGNLLSRMDWAGLIEETRGEADFNLNWSGAPNQPLLNTLHGQFSLSLNKGRLVTIGSGLGRVLGVLNIDTLKRRLMLDFSDLFEQGFAYDGVVGQFDINAGIAETHDFTVDGVAAALGVRGQLRLPDRTLGLGVQVTPKTSVTLPLAGVLAGGPAVGAAVLVAQQLLGEQVDSITSTRYTVTGDWANPVTTRLKGQGGVLDKFWQGLTDFSESENFDQYNK